MGEVNNTKTNSRFCTIAIIVGVAIGTFVIGILIGRFATCPDADGVVIAGVSEKIIQDGDPAITDILIQNIFANNIRDNLKLLTEKPHIAGEQEDFDLVDTLKRKFLEYGLDSAKASPYKVLLSYPDTANPNSAKLIGSDGSAIYDSLSGESDISNKPEVVRPFLAYSPSKSVQGELVYVNYGRVEDYNEFEQKTNSSVSNKIVIVRYGQIFRGSKVQIAADHGAIGIIIYSDPKDYTYPPEGDRVYPETWWIPPTAVQRGTIYDGDGDPLTPGYPAIRSAFRYNETDERTAMPKIPAHAISYGAAWHFLRRLEGQTVPDGWQGGLNFTYKYGNSGNGMIVNLTTATKNYLRRADNVIAIIKGEVEPDRYVLLGNHRDAWIYGSIDPSSGTAVMMEVARAMGELVKQGKWRPRRSIMFCSWGAEEYGLIGSNEYAEQYIKSLGSRAVAYVNIDIAVQGNHSLRVLGTPLLYRPVFEATKKVPNPNKTEVAAGRRTVYDTWFHNYPWTNQSFPSVGELGSGSDYASMLQITGITSVDLRYTYDTQKYKIGSYPLYHTEFETFEAVNNLIDRDFEYHQAVARVGAEMLRSLADSLIIPFNVSDYAWGLQLNRETLDNDHGERLRQNIANYSELQNAINGFQNDVKEFEKAVANINKNNPMATRMVNDQLHLLEKAFLDPAGLPDRSLKKHLLFAENSNDAYAGSSFPGLVDLLFEIDKLQSPALEQRWQRVNHHFSVIVNAIQAAGYTLRDVINFIEEQY